jgi:hypothetical protein
MFLTLATYAFAQELRDDHPTTYVVQKGDTLWDISARFLKKPWLWPEIWQANPQVKNPHLIYPGDVLSLVYTDGARISSSGPHAGEAITAVPLGEIEPFLKQLTIVQDHQSLPYVIGLEDDRLMSSSGQLAYVAGMTGAQPGQLVQLARPINRYYRGREFTHDRELNFRGDEVVYDWRTFWSDIRYVDKEERVVGIEMMRHNIGEVTQVNDGITTVLLREENRDVRVGDRILPVESQPYDPYYYPSAPASVPENSRIAAVTDGLHSAGPHQVVALSIGSAEGVKNGTTFGLWHEGAVRQDRVAFRNVISAKQNAMKMPDEFVGHVMVFRTFDRVSYGLVMDAIKPVRVGDLLKHPDATH